MKEQKGRKKGFKKWIAVGLVLLAVGGISAVTVINANTPMTVNTVKAEKADVYSTIATRGVINADESKTYFSVSSAQLGVINVEEGDLVSAGDILFTYDQDSLEKSIKSARLQVSIAESSYNNSMEINNKTQATYDNATAKVAELSDKIEKQEHELGDYEYYKWLRELELKEAGYTPEQIAADEQIINCTNEINWINKCLSENKPDLSEYKAEKKSSEASLMTESAKKEISSKKALEQLTNGDVISTLEAVKDGVASDFAGIVTSVKAVNGATVVAGTDIITVADTNTLYISVDLTKNDLENAREGQDVDISVNGNNYTGKIDKISHVATKNQNGATVTAAKISISNPDDSLILGSEAKLKIHVGESKGVLVITNDLINYGVDGPYVLVAKDGVVEKRFIKTGISSDMTTEITDGLNEGDLIISDDPEMIFEGQLVTAVEAAE